MKKGQLEMVGLSIIVIIIIVIFILFITLNRGNDTGSITSRESLYANNLLNAVMFYSLEDGSVSDYIQECDKYSNAVIPNEAKISQYCGVRNDIIMVIEPLLRTNQKYEMLFDGRCGEIADTPKVCGDEFITASPYYIRTSGTCKIILRLC